MDDADEDASSSADATQEGVGAGDQGNGDRTRYDAR